MNQQQTWMRTDTASIMFSALTTRRWGRTFRFTIELDQPVDPALLERAIRDVFPSYPSVNTDLRRGFFWTYQRLSNAPPQIRPEGARPLMPITSRYKGLPDLRFVYRGSRVSMEAAHTVGDGRGSARIFEEIMRRYVSLLNGTKEPYRPIAPPEETCENAYDTYYDPDGDRGEAKGERAYHFRERYDRDYLRLLFAETSAADVKRLAHSHGMTVTEYLSAVLILGVIRASDRPVTEPVVIAVPVDLRRFFPTKTLRNFTIQSRIAFYPAGRTDLTLETVLRETDGQLKKALQPELLRRSLNRFGSLKRNPLLRAVPYVIKRPVLAALQKRTHGQYTTIFTNLGERMLPEELARSTRRMQFVNGDTRRYGLPVTCSCVTFGDALSLCFSRANRDTCWFDACVDILREEGLSVETCFTEGSAKTERPVLPEQSHMPLRETLKAYFAL